MINWVRENRRDIIRVLGSFLALVLLVLLLEEEGDGELFSALRRVSVDYFIAAVLVLFVSRFFSIVRWHVLLRSAGVDIPFSRSAALTFAGNFSSNFLPTTIGGDVFRLAGISQFGHDRAIALASLVVDRLVGMAGMVLVLPLGLFTLFSADVALMQASVVTVWFQKGVAFVRRTIEAFMLWRTKPLALAGSLLATLGNMVFIFLAIYLLLVGIGHRVGYWELAGLYALTYFVTLIPVSINGLGVQELSLAFLLTQFGGVTSSEGATIALLTRVLFVIASLPGAVFLPSILAAIKEEKSVEK